MYTCTRPVWAVAIDTLVPLAAVDWVNFPPKWQGGLANYSSGEILYDAMCVYCVTDSESVILVHRCTCR